MLLAHPFTSCPGVSPQAEKCITPTDYFSLFFTEDVIHQESLRYAQQQMPSDEYLQQHPKARAHEWIRKPMELDEVNVLLATIILIGMMGFPRLR